MSRITSRRVAVAPLALSVTLLGGGLAHADSGDNPDQVPNPAEDDAPVDDVPVDEIEPFVEQVDAPLADVSIDYWTNRSGQSIGDVANGEAPSTSAEFSGAFEAPSNIDDNYAVRMRSVLTPTESGRYRFYVAGDDDVRLFLNKNGTQPAGARQVAYIAGWTEQHQWDRYRSQRTRWFDLEAGESYYVEMIGKEGSGSDHYSLGWKQKGSKTIELVPADVLEATNLGEGGWRQLTPIGLPDSPATFTDPQFSSASGAQTLDISWAAPENASFYKVRLEGGGEVRKVTVDDPNVSFENLVPGTRYLVEVAPGNAGVVQPPASFVAVTGYGEYPTPITPVESAGDASVVYETWDNAWWTLASVDEGTAATNTSTLSWGLEAPPMQGENHATRLRALVTPEVSGEYRLYLSGDDDARLLFNRRNHQARGARTAAYVSGWTEQYQWDRHQSQESRVYNLEAGTSYYIEAIGVHAFGLDHLEVGWSLDGGEIEVIPASVLTPTSLGGGGWRESAAALPRRADRPTDLAVERTIDTINATWTAPEATETRGEADSYVAELRIGTEVVQTINVEGTSATFDVDNTDTRYRVVVRAWNAGGRGGARGTGVAPIRPEIALTPIFECVEVTDAGSLAWFGYSNESTLAGEPTAVQRDAGNRNRIRPNALADVAVPSDFEIGEHLRVVSVDITDVTRPHRVGWRLHRSIVRVDPTQFCEVPEQPVTPDEPVVPDEPEMPDEPESPQPPDDITEPDAPENAPEDDAPEDDAPSDDIPGDDVSEDTETAQDAGTPEGSETPETPEGAGDPLLDDGAQNSETPERVIQTRAPVPTD
ncbi:MAG: PA14 domain-containing protein [Ilumatobacter sp.]